MTFAVAPESAVWMPPDDAVLADLLVREWGLCGTLTPLPSYSDHNRRVHAECGDFVLKVAHPKWALEALDFENQALLHLGKRDDRVRTPRLHPARSGAAMVSLTLADGRVAHARLIDYVQGRLLADVPMSAALAHSIGEQVAHLTQGLADFEHSAARRPMEWNLMTLPALREEIAFVADRDLRAQVQSVMEDVESQLPHWLATLPQQVVHNDANDYNVIVDARNDEVSSIIDFGDMCYSFRLSDLAVASVYAMCGQPDPLALLDILREGYESVQPLLPEERAVLLDFIRARLCLSILMATRAHRADPDNDYVLISQRGVRELLLRIV